MTAFLETQVDGDPSACHSAAESMGGVRQTLSDAA
jgi:hypothetical protein